MSDQPNEAQTRFDETYISSNELCKLLDIDRSILHNGRKRGILPNPIIVPGVNTYIWEREPLTPYLEAWKINLASRRGELK